MRFQNQSFGHLLNLERNKNFFTSNSGPTSNVYTSKGNFQNTDQTNFKFENQIYNKNNKKDNKPALFNFSIKNNVNAIIMMKDREIEKWKEEERRRREKEKQQFNALINRYDQTLSMGERENQQLKMRLKQLEGFFV